MIELHDVSKAFGGAVALTPTTLSLPRGATTVLLGPSGCGKSTLLRLMVGLLAPDTGRVLFDGVPVTPATAPRLRERIGFVVQDGGLFPHLTARQNAVLPARYHGLDRGRMEQRLEELVALTHFPPDRLENYPAQLSGGQRQRVSLMRALMLDPPLLLLDEPLGALDPLIRSDLQADLRRIFKTLGKTVVLVTHDLGEAGFLGDEIVLMQDGRIVQHGQFRDLVHHPKAEFVTRFVQAQRHPLDFSEAP